MSKNVLLHDRGKRHASVAGSILHMPVGSALYEPAATGLAAAAPSHLYSHAGLSSAPSSKGRHFWRMGVTQLVRSADLTCLA